MIINHLKLALNKGYKAEKCTICNQQFTLLLRIHKCKRCERYVCYACGKHNEPIIMADGSLSQTTHRICVLCKQDLDCIKSTITNYEMKWGKDSNFQKQWAENISQQEHNFENFLKIYYQNQQHYSESADIIQKDVLLGRTDFKVYNFSMRQFFYYMQKDKSTQTVRKNIANVLYALCSRFSSMGYCQGMSSISALLLCFASQQSAFQIFCDLIQNILPLNLYNHSQNGTSLIGLLAQTHFIKRQYFFFVEVVKNQKIDDEGRNRLQTILDLTCSKCILTLFINNLTFKNLLFFWERLKIERSFVVIDKAMIAVLYLFYESLLQNQTHYKFFQRYIEIMDPSEFKEIYQQINIDLTQRKRVIDQFHKGISIEWNKQTKSSTNKLSKISKFSQKQIEEIRKQFNGLLETPEQLGLSLEAWMRFAQSLTSKQKFKKTLNLVEGFDKNYYQNIFKQFDQQNNTIMDFRQFICGISIIVRGNLKQKILLFCQTLQQNKSLSQKNFLKMIKSVVTLLHSLFEQDQQLLSLQDRFKDRVNMHFHDKQKILLSQIQILMNHDYINTAALRTMQDTNDLFNELIQSLKDVRNK